MPSNRSKVLLLAHVSHEEESLTCYRDCGFRDRRTNARRERASSKSSASEHGSGCDLEVVLRVPLHLALVAAVGDSAVSITLPSADALGRLRGSGKPRCGLFSALQHASQSGDPEAWTLECQSPRATLQLLDRLQLAGCILQDLQRRYALLDEIGEGAFGRVFRAEDLRTGSPVAIKVCTARSMNVVMHPILEASILRSCCHANIQAFHGLYRVSGSELDIDSSFTYAIVSEYVEGGELLKLAQRGTAMTEDFARRLTKQLLSAVSHLQEKSMVHRDIKPENILLSGAGDQLKLVDFGLSALEDDSEAMRLKSGSPGYVAPEVVTGVQTCKADCFSVGAILFILLTGKPPFAGKDQREVLMKNVRGKVDMDALWNVSQGARDVVASLMCRDPQSRASAAEALRLPWFTQPPQAAQLAVPSAAPAGPRARRHPGASPRSRAPRLPSWPRGVAPRRCATPPSELLAPAAEPGLGAGPGQGAAPASGRGQGLPTAEAAAAAGASVRGCRSPSGPAEPGPQGPGHSAAALPADEGFDRAVASAVAAVPIRQLDDKGFALQMTSAKLAGWCPEQAESERPSFKDRPSFSERATEPIFNARAGFIRKVMMPQRTQLEKSASLNDPAQAGFRAGGTQIKLPSGPPPGGCRRPCGLRQNGSPRAPCRDIGSPAAYGHKSLVMPHSRHSTSVPPCFLSEQAFGG
ncbi:unnamed protein product [Prorocentrum cordatum]|uniref:non-specific serine/threonine protein kinase n=1 Tax=Prorocentrum cordatum TaxID=2364126 RepID=A0ABN9WGA0_9DINO|nr:unnamed protein product [Polarella glacialis]